jgi:DNA helicase HerA-like ATPase
MDSIAKTSAVMHDLPTLISDPENSHVGFVVSMTYDKVLVLTNDQWKHRCGGIPQNSFLVAASFNPAEFEKTPEEDRTVVLLRVVGPKPLPSDGDTLKSIVEKYQRATGVQAEDQHDGFERITMSRLQYSGMECHILGSFQVDQLGRLTMGSDVEDYFAVARLRVYKPVPQVLERIVNFISPDRLAKAEETAELLLGALPEPIPIGTVRYTSSTAVQRAQKADVPVRIQPLDFLARRTAVFGMTRTGKSNTVKTMSASVAIVAKKAGVKIGQIIFDVKGEYANANGKDDGSSLAEALSEDVVRYRALEKTGFHDLRDNLYRSLDTGLHTVQLLLKSSGLNTAQDMGSLMGLSLVEPTLDDFAEADKPQDELRRAASRHKKKVAIYKCILFKAGLTWAKGDNSINFEMGKAVYEQLHEHIKTNDCDRTCSNKEKRVAHAQEAFGEVSSGLTLEQATGLFIRLRTINRLSPIQSSTAGVTWLDETERGLLNVLAGKSDNDGFIRSTRVIGDAARPWHSATGSDNVPRDVYKHLVDGKIVIVDLSVGNERTAEDKSVAIAEYIRGQAFRAASEEKEPPIIMMYVEEAHNLIGEKQEITSTWPRIAKEGAAMNIGLVYCTQEPSSINGNILANTENFFVTHLNNDDEIRTISKFYDFADFAGVIKKATDVGFSRIKTLSSSFVMPTQILQFKPEDVKAEYSAARPKPGHAGRSTNGSAGT